ncbi:MAG: hypothetical protein KDE31_08945, partial [Caldilineaceae bacterium]|nr:hypothetical protein [Caldilineaceae bacterium]
VRTSGSAARRGVGRPTPVEQPNQLTSEQNPEVLHWRANRLLDEMMLGAIDIAANDSVPARALTTPYATPRNESPYRESVATTPSHGEVQLSRALNEHDSYRVQPFSRPSLPGGGDTRTIPEQSVRAAPLPFEDDSNRLPVHNQLSATDTMPTDTPSLGTLPPVHGALLDRGERSRAVATGEQPTGAQKHSPDARPGPRTQTLNGTEQWLFAAEQRYEQLAARQQATDRENSATGYANDGWSLADEPSASAGGARLVPPYSRDNNFDPLPAYGQNRPTIPSSPKQDRSAKQPESKTTGGVRKNLRSNLLPRMSDLDSRAVHQEMAMLQNSIDSALAEGHESRVRAQHLLQKAATILQNDPSRSAEVDYYLQQVRMIVRRVQETAQWSELYKRQLRTYLLAWLALSLIFVVGRYLYPELLATLIERISGQRTESLLVYNLLTIATAFFFGAFGGGIGALVNLARHVRQGYRFFDRKYGLRGLILPLIGALCGLVLCLVFGVVYTLLGVEPATSLWFGLIPALLALLLGASQEHFYGTLTP